MQRLLTYILCCLLPCVTLAYDPYSNSELDMLQKQFLEEINRSPAIIRSPLSVEYLNLIGERLAHAGNMPASSFFIVNSGEMNAFAGPGGYIGVHSSLILATANEDELAAVMAHELAHVKLHHLYDMIEHEKLMRIPTAASMLAAIALGVVNPVLGTGAMAATLSGAAQQSINYTRYHERQADRIGMQMLKGAGYNPLAMAGFFKKLQQQSRYYDIDHIPAILRTHPLDQERIAEAEDRVPKPYSLVFNQSLDYRLFKTLVQQHASHDPKALLVTYRNATNTPENQYGLALSLIETNRFKEAMEQLSPLVKSAANQPFYATALADAALGAHESMAAIDTLQALDHAHPNHKAFTYALADAYLAANQAGDAATLLTKAFRQYPRELSLCKMLAKAEAQNHRPAYAYFIESQCDHMQGHDQLAILRLKTAQKLIKHDAYLKARIEAKLEEIREMGDFKTRR